MDGGYKWCSEVGRRERGWVARRLERKSSTCSAQVQEDALKDRRARVFTVASIEVPIVCMLQRQSNTHIRFISGTGEVCFRVLLHVPLLTVSLIPIFLRLTQTFVFGRSSNQLEVFVQTPIFLEHPNLNSRSETVGVSTEQMQVVIG